MTGRLRPYFAFAALLSGCGSNEVAAPDGATAVSDRASNVSVVQNVNAAPAPKRLTRAELREKARTDPDEADAQAIGQMSRNELVATSINSAGYLCARVTDLYMSGDDIVAHCVEYRSGAGKATYRINPGRGTVEQTD